MKKMSYHVEIADIHRSVSVENRGSRLPSTQ